jgi:hypothetical protein
VKELQRQQDSTGLRNRHGRGAEMLAEEPPELTLANAEAPRQGLDTAFVERSRFNEGQRATDGIRRSAPGRQVGRRFRPAAKARPVTCFLCGRGRREEEHVFALRRARGTDRAAVDSGRSHAAEQASVESPIARSKGTVASVGIKIHVFILAMDGAVV